MNLSDVFSALLWICLLMLLAKFIRRQVRVLKSLFLPSPIIAGALSLAAIGANAAPFAILMMGGILWNLCGFFVVARMMFPRDWVPNGLANFGQGMGMTVVGLLLVAFRIRVPAMYAGAPTLPHRLTAIPSGRMPRHQARGSGIQIRHPG